MMVSAHAGQMAPISAIIAGDTSVNGLFSNTSDGSIRRFGAKQHIFFEGDDRDNIYEVVEGVVCVYAILADGRRQVISFCYPGSLLGFGYADSYLHNAEALSATTLRCYSAGALENLATERPDLSQSLLSFMIAELSAARDQLLTLGRKSAPEKIASFLLDLSQHNLELGENPAVLQLPMTRSDIGDYLGLTIETVSRNFTKLRSQGVIDLHQSTTVIILDMDRLEDIASCDEGNF